MTPSDPSARSTEDPRQILEQARTVAVLGAHDDPSRAACYVPDYLHSQGYRIFPVNSTRTGQSWWGQPVLKRLDECAAPIDLVDVFRRPELLDQHLEEILAMRPLPRWVWLQQGITNDSFAEALRGRGIAVVQDRCTLADHRRFGLGPR